jgi:hypothetical protein
VRENLFLAAMAIIAGHAVYSWIDSRNLVMADEAKQSSFLRSDAALLFHKDCRAGVSTGLSATPGATGFLYIEPARDVRFTKIVETGSCGSSDSAELLATLELNVRSALDDTGCAVLSDQLADRELRIAYRCGARTNGVVAVRVPGQMLNVRIDERWAIRG